MSNLQVKKLRDGDNYIYPLSVDESTVICKPIKIEHDIGSYKKGETIYPGTTLGSVLTSILSGKSKEDNDNPQISIENDYTAFEVFPTKEDIPAGTVSQDVVSGKWWKPNTEYSVDSYVLVKNQEKIYTCIKGGNIKSLNIEPGVTANWETYWKVTYSKSTIEWNSIDCYRTNQIVVHNGTYYICLKNCFTILSIEPGVTEGWEEYWVEGNDDFDGYYYKYTKAVPANNTINTFFYINSKKREECDIVIDWGDGTISKVADLNDNSVKSFGSYTDSHGTSYTYGYLTMTHTYTDCVSRIENGKLVESKKYIVKIYGKDYFMVRFGNLEANNIVSRICDIDLPIASNVTNISSTAAKSLRLLYLNVPYQYNFKNVTNFSGLVGYCDNLRYAAIDSGTKFNIDCVLSIQAILVYDINLLRAIIHPTSYAYQDGFGTFATGCKNLHEDVLNILPKHGFTRDANMTNAFNGCAKLTCSDYDKLANMLWNNTNVKFTSTSGCFAGCSAEFRSHIPTSWGGTKS